MSRVFGLFGLVVAVSVMLAGCAAEQSAATGEKSSSEKSAAGGAAQAPPKSEAETIAENLAQLSPEDRKLAEEQWLCPVGDSPLGGMGVPYKMIVRGQPVFLCCQHCESVVEKDRDAILAKVEKLKQRKSSHP